MSRWGALVRPGGQAASPKSAGNRAVGSHGGAGCLQRHRRSGASHADPADHHNLPLPVSKTRVTSSSDSGAPPPPAGAPALVVRDIAKTYGPVKALQPASLEMVSGEVHALVGENGSGKSTLVGIVSGTVKPDLGTVEIAGRRCVKHTPWESQLCGALTVFQDGSVLPELTVAQNLYLGTPASQRPGYRRLDQWAGKKLRELGLERMSARASAGRLSPADRQLLEIARALMARPTVLMLDEATSALDPAGVDAALSMIRRQATEYGCAVLFVTHRLSEVFRVADRISVLRDGIWRGTYEADAMDAVGLVELMAGRSVNIEFPPRARPEEIGEPVVVAEQLRGPGYGPIDLTIRSGEIVGIAGADGNGQLELLHGLCATHVPAGRLEVKGAPIASYGDASSSGVALLSSDRRNESLFPTLAIRENLTVGVLGSLGRLGIISHSRETEQVQDSIDRFGIRLGSAEDAVTSLSGGNQQKVALGRVLATEPDVILTDEPTQGVDVRSRLDIYRMLRDSAQHGKAVVIVSSDAAELAGLCDRIVVISRGEITAELDGESASEERVVHAFAGAERLATSAAAASGESPQQAPPRAWRRVRELADRYQNGARLLLILALLIILGGYTATQNSSFLTTAGLYNVTLLALPLAAVAAAEFAVMFIGGIDVSVGGAMGVTVAVLSFVAQSGALIPALAIGIGTAIGVGLVIGSVNATLIERIRISPVIATIATLGILQGIGLVLRPTAAGNIAASLLSGLTKQVWFFPWALLVVAILFVVADRTLRRSGAGLRMRAVGLNPQFAFRLGVNAPRVRQVAYVLCAILAALAGLLLAGQVGVGDSTVGSPYTLVAIAAPILGGASLLGGRGTFVGCLLGALLLSLGQTLPTTLGLAEGTSYYLTGGLTLLALLIYTTGSATAVKTYVRTAARKLSTLRLRSRAAGAGKADSSALG